MNLGQDQRFRSGELCEQSGNYEFDGFVSGPDSPGPSATESCIALEVGAVFPPIPHTHRPCYWRLADGHEPQHWAAILSTSESLCADN